MATLIPLWFIIFYPLVVAIFLIMLFLSIRKYLKYSIFTRELSDLGRRNTLSCVIYNRAISFYSLIHLPWVYFLFSYINQHFAWNIFSLLGLIIMVLACISGFISGFIPQTDGKRVSKHDVFSGISFCGYVLSSVLLVYPFILTKLFWILPFTILSLVMFVFLSISFFKLGGPYLISDTKRPLMQNICFWGCMLFISMMLWLFLVYIAMVI
jgi:hypothetical membrane protein